MDQVRQCLFGYQDGHTLLATSIELPLEARRILLVQTDYPGTPGSDQTVEGMIAGYPLGSTGLYAVTRTWLAPEMPRPGCVFTHAIIIDEPFLTSQRDLAQLLPFFRRPNALEGYGSFAVDIDGRGQSIPSMPDTYRSQIGRVVGALFLTNEPIVVAVDEWSEYAVLALRLWSVEWPALRRRFMFSTGGGSPRALGKAPFDLQFVLSNRAPRFRDRTLIRWRPPSATIGQVANEWIDDLTQFVAHGTPTTATDSLWALGPTAPPGRASVAQIATVATSLRAGVTTAVKTAADLFPDSSEARDLKQALLHGRPGEVDALDDIEVIALLIDDEHVAAAFDVADDELTAALISAAHATPALVADIVARATRIKPSVTRAFLNRISDSPQWIEAVVVASRRNGNVADIVGLLAPGVQLALLQSSQPEVRDAFVGAIKEEPRGVESLALRLFDDGEQSALSTLSDAAPAETISALLDAANHATDRVSSLPLTIPWERGAADWLRAAPRVEVPVAAFLANHLSASDKRLLSIGPKSWVELVDAIVRDPIGADLQAAAFLFVLGLIGNAPKWAPLVAAGFVSLHEREGASGLPDAIWRQVEPHVPRQRFWGDWDRCRRLRSAFIRFFSRHDGDKSIFRRAASQTDIRRIQEEAGDINGAGSYVRRAIAAGR